MIKSDAKGDGIARHHQLIQVLIYVIELLVRTFRIAANIIDLSRAAHHPRAAAFDLLLVNEDCVTKKGNQDAGVNQQQKVDDNREY